jgi:hypothetical protein
MSNLLRHRKVHDGIRPFECTRCEKKFSSISNLNQHMLIHDKKSARFKFVCFAEGCDQSYFYICTLKNHIVKFHHSLFCRIEEEYKNRSFIDIFKFLSAKRNRTINESFTIETFFKEMPENFPYNDQHQVQDQYDDEKKENTKLSRNLFKILKIRHEPINENSKSEFLKRKIEAPEISEEKPRTQFVTDYAIRSENTFNTVSNSNYSSHKINQEDLIKKFSTTTFRMMEIQIINITFNYLLHNYTIFNELSKISELTKLHSIYHYNAVLKNHEQNKAIVALLHQELSFCVARGLKTTKPDKI